MGEELDYDWVVIGSGFGGAVSALRLTEKGYRVLVIEAGSRFEDEDFANSTWNLRKYLYVPKLGLRGILRMYVFKDVAILAGAGVGGGSLVYANTLYVPPTPFFEAEEWSGLADWGGELAPHYAEAKRMLGATNVPFETDADRMLKQVGEDMGVGHTYARPEVSVYFGDGEGAGAAPGVRVPDPFFGGDGPDRAACIRCGGCMIGCRHNAKNTLMKNYLWFAERGGAEILPDTTVKDIRPIEPFDDGSAGYELTAVRSGGTLRKGERKIRAKGVVVSAGAVGTNLLLARCLDRGSLPRLSRKIGYRVRTNSEALLAVTAKDDKHDFASSVAITSSIYPDDVTHIENVTYGGGGGAMSFLFTLLTEEGTRLTRPLKWLGQVVRHPIHSMRLVFGRASWSRRTIILLVMQTLNNSLRLRPVKVGNSLMLQTEQDPDNPNPTYIAPANEAAASLAKNIGGIAQSNVTEALLNTPATAHILGGAVIGSDPEDGVIDHRHRAFGYENLIVSDGSVIPANPGVNPSLTITALAERAMSFVEEKDGAVASDGAEVHLEPASDPSQ